MKFKELEYERSVIYHNHPKRGIGRRGLKRGNLLNFGVDRLSFRHTVRSSNLGNLSAGNHMTQASPVQRYLDLAPESDCTTALRVQFEELFPTFLAVPAEQTSVLHAPYTWTIKQVIGHLTDTERIFSYRALRFARGDENPLPSFDQDAYMLTANFNEREYEELIQEFFFVRQATIALFNTLPEGALERSGNASGLDWTVRKLGRCSVGHVRHHWEIVEQRLAT